MNVDQVSLALPAHACNASAVRLYAASLARSVGCSEETVEDLKVAVSEVFATAVVSEGSNVSISALIDDTALTLRFDDVVMPEGGDLSAVSTLMVRALFPSAEIDREAAFVSISVRP